MFMIMQIELFVGADHPTQLSSVGMFHHSDINKAKLLSTSFNWNYIK